MTHRMCEIRSSKTSEIMLPCKRQLCFHFGHLRPKRTTNLIILATVFAPLGSNWATLGSQIGVKTRALFLVSF